MDVANWHDYDGEQLQLITKDNFALLTSSFDTNCISGKSDKYKVTEIAENAISNNGEVHDLSLSEDTNIYNRELFDTRWSFNKAITFNGNRAIVLPILKWRDYQGEQLQIITTDGLVLNLCSYNTKLVFDVNSEFKANDFASCYVGSDGKVTDYVDVEKSPTFNYDVIDTKYAFNKALIIKDKQVVIIPVKEWCDFEGEQLQIKIDNGPTIVTAAYDTILINDIHSNLKATDIASSLAESNVVDFTTGYTYDKEILFNGTIADLKYSFSNAIVSNANSAASFKIEKWNDYEGEQLQVKLESGDTLLTSSMLLDLINSGTSTINATSLASGYVDESGKLIDSSKDNYDTPPYNKYILDTEVKYKYALKIVNGNVTIIPLKSWQDFYNTDGKQGKNSFPFAKVPSIENITSFIIKGLLEGDKESEEEELPQPNCEQLQLVLPDGSTIVTTAYDTVLVNNTSDINDIAKMFIGPNGIISDLTPYVGEPDTSLWNISLFDTKYSFSYAILSNGNTSQIFSIKQWLDFVEGEQLQLKLDDDTRMLTSFVNTTLVSTNTEFLEETLAAAFNGTLMTDTPVVKRYYNN